MFPLTYIGNILSRHIAFPAVLLALALAAACGGPLGDTVDAGGSGLEVLPDGDGLITRNEAEELATEWLAMSAPEVSGTEIERVWASCLSTLRSYEQDLLEGNDSTYPAFPPPGTPVWIVEVKGISLPAGISPHNARQPYRYALAVINAETGDSIASTRRRETLMEPAREAHQ